MQKMVKEIINTWKLLFNYWIVVTIILCANFPYFFTEEVSKEEKVKQNQSELMNMALEELGYDAEVERAVMRGLDYLARVQRKDGSFGERGYKVAVTSLAGMAFMAQGSTPYKGKYGDNIVRAVKYVMSQAGKKGFIGVKEGDQGAMHGHSFAVMFLAQAYGEIKHGDMGINKEELKEIIKRGVKLIEVAQSKNGGWFYYPTSGTQDENSVTVCAVAALRIAYNAGFPVNKAVQTKGLEYIKKCANEDGSFAYSLAMRSSRTLALTGAGVATLLLYGDYDAKEVKNGMKWLLNNINTNSKQQGHFYYTQFYTNYAFLFAAKEERKKWFNYTKKLLLENYNVNGSFSPIGYESSYGGNTYPTAFATLTLQMPKQLLPMFQD